MEKSLSGNSKNAHRVVASLDREQIDFLDKIGKDALFSVGTKLSRTTILSAMVDALKKLDISGEGITSKKALEERILELIRERTKQMEQKGFMKRGG